MKFFKVLMSVAIFLILTVWVLIFKTPRVVVADSLNCGKWKNQCCTGPIPPQCDLGLTCQSGICETATNTNTTPPTSKVAFPGNGNKVPCQDTANPEFNSDRPYQASPCGDAPKALFCSNSVVLTLGSVSTGDCGSDVCMCEGTKCSGHVDQLIVDLTNVQLPVLGNTQEIKNGVSSTSTLDDATLMNQYLSPYLNGTNTRAEYGAADPTKVVDFAGPINKLLPQQIAEQQRIITINSTGQSSTSEPNDSGQTTSENSNHNQIAVCGKKELSLPSWLTWLPDLFHLGSIGIGREIPVDCYSGDGSGTAGNIDVFRLSGVGSSDNNWAGTDNFQEALSWAGQYFSKMFPGNIPAQILANAATRWQFKIPPLPWNDGTGKAFASSVLYQKAYNEWRGNLCAIIGGHLFCFNVWPFINNPYADLFPYVPLANTVDKSATQLISSVEIQSGGRAEIDHDPNKTNYQLNKSPNLYFPHTQETADLTSLLQKTFKARGQNSEVIPNDVASNSSCQTLQSYTNPGDNVTFTKPKSYLEVDNINYHVLKISCTSKIVQVCDAWDDPINLKGCRHETDTIVRDCSDDIYVTIPMANRTPNLDDIWKNTVAGSQSIFRRIYPQTGVNAPITCIGDNPGVSPVTYTSESKPQLMRVIEPDGSSVGSGGKTNPSIDAQMYFPHLGGVEQYFLQGIQTALRPLGYGEQNTSSQYCSNIQCGELPKFPPAPANSGCGVGSTNAMVGDIPKSLKDIVAAASQTYKVPGNLILGVMYGEGLFNTDSTAKHYTRLNWTDTNVKNWATCQKVPGCNETGDDNFMGFNGNDWTNIQNKILPDLKKLDPTKKTADRCNLLDAIYGEAWNLHDSADGGMAFQCYGLDLKASIPTSCDWNPNQYESAIKIAENGYDHGCFTLPGSCATGGGNAALCPGGGDTCEHVGDPGNTSHNACVWDVAHGN